MNEYITNIEDDTLENVNYRKVVYTGKHIQLVLMSLEPYEDIPWEIHRGDQFIRVESGSANIYVEHNKYVLNDNDICIIPANKKHYVSNASKKKPLKLYTIYTPPEHDDNELEYEQPDK